MSVISVITQRTRAVLTCALSGSTSFQTLTQKRHDFREQLLNIKCVSWFPLQLLSEKFLILRIIQRDIINNNFNFNYNQQDAAILIYLFLKSSTCFRRSLRPSSGANNCTHSFRYCQPVLLPVGMVAEMELTSVSSISATNKIISSI